MHKTERHRAPAPVIPFAAPVIQAGCPVGTLLAQALKMKSHLSIKASFVMVSLAAATIVAAGNGFVAQADVRVTCPMTVGGSFEVKTAALSGSVTSSAARPSGLDGSLVVDLRTLDSGISLRNEHLRGTYLEVDKAPGYDKAVLSDIDLKGVNPEAPDGKGSFAGSLMLHGVKNTVSGPVELRKSATGLQVKASFPVDLSDYNIAKPRYLGIGVKNTVHVEVVFTVTP